MSATLIIYVHGFNSSPQSWKAQQLQSILQNTEYQVEVPALSHWPAEAIKQLSSLIKKHSGPVLLLGSSLGGYYSLWLTEHYPQCRAVLVNPAIYPYRLLSEWLGENQNYYTAERYQLTDKHLQQLLELEVEQLNDPSRYLLLLQTADETLDYRHALEKLPNSPAFVQEGGSHGFEQFEKLIPAVLAFAEGRVALPEPTPLPIGPQLD